MVQRPRGGGAGSALPSTPDAKPSPVEKLETETPLETATPPDVAVAEDAALSAAQEEAWAKAEVAVPGTSAAPTTLEANLEDARGRPRETSPPPRRRRRSRGGEGRRGDDDEEAFSAQTDAAFAEAERASAIDAGSGAAVPTALVAPLAEDALRDAGAPGGGVVRSKMQRVPIDSAPDACYEGKKTVEPHLRFSLSETLRS